jgi:hypothetical protein
VIDAAGHQSRPLADRVKAAMWPRGTDVLSGESGLARLLHGQFIYCPSISYRRDITGSTSWDGRWAQVMDLDLFCHLLLDGHSIALCDEAVYRYRRHSGSATSRNTATVLRLDEESRLCSEVGALAARRGWHHARRASLMRTTVRLHGVLQTLAALRRGQVAEARRCLALALGR